MSYTAPTTRSSGALITASIWNTDLVDNIVALRAGALSIASQAAGDLIGASSATQLSRVAAVASGQVMISGGVGTLPKYLAAGTDGYHLRAKGAGVDPIWEAVAASGATLLKANEGSSTNTSANNLDTVSISGLTSLDSLWVLTTLEAVTQDCAACSVYHSTDSVVIDTSSTITAGQNRHTLSCLRPAKSNPLTIFYRLPANFQAAAISGVTISTGWGSAWTLALRSGGVTSGGTLYWKWQVLKMAGQ